MVLSAGNSLERVRPMNFTKRQTEAAERFKNALYAANQPRHADADDLIACAFLLYNNSWGASYDVRQWDWPISEIANEEAPFAKGNEPWTVLLRAAVELVHPLRLAKRV